MITQLEPDFKYALRVTSASINGLGLPSEPYYFWAGLLPTEPYGWWGRAWRVTVELKGKKGDGKVVRTCCLSIVCLS